MALQSGTTAIPAWKEFDANSLMTQVTFPEAFDATPSIAASLVCDTRPQPATAGIRVMNPSAVGFTAYLQLADAAALTVEEARSFNWRVTYVASTD